MSQLRLFVPAVMLLLSLSQSVFAGPVTALFYSSGEQSWVGGGETVQVTPDDGFSITANLNHAAGVSFSINDFSSNNFWDSRWWYLDFAAPAAAQLQVGSYQNATRFPFQSPTAAGLSFSGNGRGDNTLTGNFEVLQADYAADGSILAFAANFIQYDEGITSWWNIGGIRYNSDVAIGSTTAVPEPSSLMLLAMGLFGFIVLRRKA